MTLFVSARGAVSATSGGAVVVLFVVVATVTVMAACGPVARPPSPPSTEPQLQPPVSVDVEFLETAAAAAASRNGGKLIGVPKVVPMPHVQKRFEVKFPPVKTKKLPSGLRVYHVHYTRLPLVTIDLVFRAGSAYDPDDLSGLAAFTALMLKEGTRRRGAVEIAEAFESLGTELSIWTDLDASYLSVTCLREHFDEVMALVAEIVLLPAFSNEEIEILRSRELGRIKLNHSDPSWLAKVELMRRLYGDHPYSRYDATMESLGRLKRDDLLLFYSKHYCGSCAFLSIVGDVSFQTACEVAQKHFKRLPRGKMPIIKEGSATPPGGLEIVVVDRPGSVETVFQLGAVAVERKSPEYIPLQVANYILGGSASSRLFLRIREKESKAYSIGSSLRQTVWKGAWTIWGATRTEATAETLSSILEEVKKIRLEDASPEEVEEAVSYLSGSFPLRIETTEQIADRLIETALYGLPLEYWDFYQASLSKVTAEEIRSLSKKYLDSSKLVVVLVGDAEAISPSLKSIGKVIVVDGK